MRINEPRTPQVSGTDVSGVGQPKQVKSADGEARASEAHDRGSVKVNVSAKAREMSQKATVDEAKVARLKDQIEKGEFKVDARAIAAKIVGDDA